MRGRYTQLYIHLVWATWDRLPLLSAEVELLIFPAILAKCQALKCEPVAIGGIEDHVHLLVRLDPAVSVSQLVKELKGSSSHLIGKQIPGGETFKWQGGYGAFSVGASEKDRVVNYIRNQKTHHRSGELERSWEEIQG
jgi:putative transposase